MLNIPTLEPDDLPFHETPFSEENRRLRQYIRRLEHEMFFLYVFITAQDICEEACDFLQSHEEDPVPFQAQL